jgi:hypothetical protein
MQSAPGQDQAEAITILKESNGSERLLVVYDSPSEARRSQDRVEADLFEIEGFSLHLLKTRGRA